MNFLEKIDIIYEEERNKYNISKENTVFSSFIPIEPIGYNTTCGFIIKKQDKSKLLLRDGKQFTFFSDLQVMNTICNMGKEDVEWFLQRFIKLYIGQSSQVQFRLNGEVFNGCGIEKYPEKKELETFSDSTIDINDFVFLLNFIFIKDKCWEELKGIQDFSKRTLSKYIALIDYYVNNTKRSKDFLNSIGYPIESTKLIDDAKTKKLFNNTKRFDILSYE